MAKFTEILLRQGGISPEQLEEAMAMARDSGTKVSESLVRLGYANGDDVMRAIAAEHHLDFVNLEEVTIPPAVRVCECRRSSRCCRPFQRFRLP